MCILVENSILRAQEGCDIFLALLHLRYFNFLDGFLVQGFFKISLDAAEACKED